tara:strand:- start:101 stop:562 length:462 start_codon:yes stop_codon:yes gene_type:complete
MLLRHGIPKRNIVTFSFDDALVSQSSTGLYHKSSGEIKTGPSSRSNKVGTGLRCGLATSSSENSDDEISHVLSIDYSGHMLLDEKATIAEKFEDMAVNDFIKTHNVVSVLRGESEKIQKECAKKTNEDVHCTGRVIRSGEDDHVLIHLNGHGK